MSLMATLSFAETGLMPTIASDISVKAATVDATDMGPLGQANPAPNQISTEVKMDIINNSKQNALLVAATSPVAQKVQLHTFVRKDGKAVMEQIAHVDIKAHTADDLSFQGVHVMLIGLSAPVTQGQQIPVTLIFADGSHLNVNAVVQ